MGEAVKIKWSHSSLKDYEGCQRRYHEVKVLKKYPFQETEATIYGNVVHEAIELYIRDGKPIPEKYAQFKPVVDSFLAKPGRKFAEYEMALTKDLKVCNWKSPDAWVRGIADVLSIDDENLTAIYAELRSRFAGYDAKELRKFPEIRKGAATEAQRILDEMKGFMSAFKAAA